MPPPPGTVPIERAACKFARLAQRPAEQSYSGETSRRFNRWRERVGPNRPGPVTGLLSNEHRARRFVPFAFSFIGILANLFGCRGFLENVNT